MKRIERMNIKVITDGKKKQYEIDGIRYNTLQRASIHYQTTRAPKSVISQNMLDIVNEMIEHDRYVEEHREEIMKRELELLGING